MSTENGSPGDHLYDEVGEGDEESTQESRESAEYSTLEEKKLSDCHAEHMQDRQQDRELRKSYAKYSFWFAVSSAIFFAFILVWNGCAAYYLARPPFSDALLATLTTAVTINLFAAFLVVAKGLFRITKDA